MSTKTKPSESHDNVNKMEEGLLKVNNPHISPENAKQIEEDLASPEEKELSSEQIEEDPTFLDHKNTFIIDPGNPNHVKVLRSSSKLHWSRVLANIILIQDHDNWTMFLIFLLYINYIVKMYVMAFVKISDSNFVFALNGVTNLAFFSNYVGLVITYFWKKLHLVLIHKKKGKYRLIFDGFLMIPYDTIYDMFSKGRNYSVFYNSLTVVSFLRLYYVLEFFKEKSSEAGLKHWNYFVTKYVMQLFWFTHTIACILFLLAYPYGSERPKGWAYVVKTNVTDSEIWYIYASYMVFMGLSNAGYGQFLATNYYERIIMTITMCCGFALTTLVLIGALSSDMVNKSNRLDNIRIQLNAIKAHLQMIGMSQRKSSMIMNYYRLFWKKKKGVKEASAINLLPTPLQMEISFDINYYFLQCSLLFRNKPEPFLRTLSLSMKHEFFQPGEVIYRFNVIKFKMICVASGIIEVTSDEDFDSPIISFGRGSVLGEAALVLTLPSRTTVRAANYCELQVLYKVDFVPIIKLFPEIYLQLRESILTRIDHFRHDQYRIEITSKANTLNLYVSQKMHLSAIKRVKKRLLNEEFEDDIPSHHHSCGLYRYSHNVKKKKGRYISLTRKFPWILNPGSSFHRVWEIIILVTVILIGFIYPHFNAYYRTFPFAVFALSILFDIIYFLDFYIILTTAIEGKDYLIKSFWKILGVHLKTFRFYLEILSTLPIEYFFLRSTTQIFYAVKINRLLKFYRIYTYFHKMETQLLTENILALRLIKYAIYIVMVNYWYGVLLYWSTCFEPYCKRDGWFRTHLLSDHEKQLASPCSNSPTLMSTYFGLTVLSTLGFGDIAPANIADMLLLIVGVILGIFLFGYCTSELAATITYLNQMKTNFQSSLYAVEKFLIDNKMDINIRDRVMRFLELQWYHNKGVHFWKETLLYNAPQRIQKEVIVKECMAVLSSVPFFQNVETQFVELIALGARIIVLPPGEVITYPGGSSRDMYIIQQGFCIKEKEPGDMEYLGPGDQFCLRNILRAWPNLYRITSLTHVKIIAISDTVYHSAISLFPEQSSIIKSSLPPENLEFLQEMKNCWGLWTFVSSSLMQEKRRKRRIKFKQWIIQSIKESFIYVPEYCESIGEDYDAPFKEMGILYRLKYALLPFCILPQGLFLKIWVGIRLTAATLLALLIPFQLIQAPYIPGLDPVMMILDAIAYIDLYVMLLVGYYGQSNQLIIHPYKTAKNYLKRSFVLDVILCFPWEVLLISLVPEHNEGHSQFGHVTSPHWMHCSVRMIKILQAYKLPMFFGYLERNIRITGLYIQVFKFLPFTLIFLNVCTALLVITSCKYFHRSDLKFEDITGDMATPPGMGTKRIQEYTMFCKRDSWIERSKWQWYHRPESIYILAFYWATTTLVGGGFGDLTAQDFLHLIIISIMMMCGTFFFGYVFAYISSYTSDLHSIFSIYQGMVSELKTYFHIESVPKSVRELILENAAYRWNRSEGMEPNKILSIVHPALHEDAVLHLYQNTLKQTPLFEGVDSTFFRIIGKALQERYYIKGSYLFREDDVLDSIYIIHRGRLEIKFYHNFYEEMVTYIGEGGMLGNIGNHVKSRMLSTAIASTNMDTLYMRTDDFYRILNKYPDVKKKIDASFAREEHKDFCVPITMIDEEPDSALDSDSDESDDRDKSFKSGNGSTNSSLSGSIERPRSLRHRKVTAGRVIQTEWMVFLFIFTPRNWFRMAILPDSKVLYALVVTCVIAAYVNTLLVTYQFAFQDFHGSIIVFLIFIDIINIWNIFLELHTAYVNRYSDYIISNKKIKKRYFINKSRRVIEFIANLPIAYFAFLLPKSIKLRRYTVFSFLKLISLMRILTIRQFFNSRRANLMMNRLVLKLIAVFIWMSMTIHIFSCVWYIFSCTMFYCHIDSWSKVFHEKPRSQFEVYIISTYFIMWVSTNTGFGDITPERYLEIIFLIVLMLTTKFVIGIFIGMAANIMSLHSSFLTRYEEGIYELRDYLRNENVSDHQMEKMWNYVKQLWAKRSGRQLPTLVLETMSYTNQSGLKYAIYGEEMEKSYLFHDLGESFLRQLSYHINPVMFFPGNYIVQHGDSDQSMYFVHRGEVDVLTVHPNLTETIHDVLHKGEMFGLPQGLFYGIPHQFSYRARTTVDIGVLQLKDWTDTMVLFPRAKEIIYKRALVIYTIL